MERSKVFGSRTRLILLGGGFLSLVLCICAILAILAANVWNWSTLQSQEGIEPATLSLELQWTREVKDGSISDPPWYYEGIVLVRSSRVLSKDMGKSSSPLSQLDAYDGETGEPKWTFARDAIGVRRDMDLGLDAGGQVIAIMHLQGQVDVLDVREGSLRWKRGTDAIHSLVADDSALYVSGIGQVRAYDLATGVWLWESDLPEEGYLGLALDQGRLYALRRKVWILDPTTGEIKTILDKSRCSDAILISQGRIFAHGECDEPGWLVAYDGETGDRLWGKPFKPENPYWRVTIVDDMLLLRTESGSLVAADINTGESFWEYHPAGGVEVISNVAVLNDLVYFLVSDKTLRAVELHTGKQVGQLQSRYMRSWHDLELGEYISVPGVAASESLLFVSFGGRTLYAFAPKD